MNIETELPATDFSKCALTITDLCFHYEEKAKKATAMPICYPIVKVQEGGKYTSRSILLCCGLKAMNMCLYVFGMRREGVL